MRALLAAGCLALGAVGGAACEGSIHDGGERDGAAAAATDAPATSPPGDGGGAGTADARAPGPTDAAAGPGPSDAPPSTGADAATLACPSPRPLDCSPGTGTGEADECFDGVSCYLGDVQHGVTATIAAHPEWFGEGPGGCPLILDVGAYMDSVTAEVVGRGLCAIRDPNAPDEEVTVKHDNAFSENFDIVASTGCARYGDLIYTGYCAPAWW